MSLVAGWVNGANITPISAVAGNLVWVLLGNALGALLGLVLPFCFAYGSLGDGAGGQQQRKAALADDVRQLTGDD